jgi:two-component system chemotaxis response regulator CheB
MPTKGLIRVLVAEESTLLRERMVLALGAAPGVEVVAETADGRAAVELCVALRPDVAVLGLVLPGMSGAAATEYLMRHCPMPVLIVSDDERAANLGAGQAARAAGAIEVLQKPRSGAPGSDWDAVLVATVRLIARIRVVTRIGPVVPMAHQSPAQSVRPTSAYGLLAIGASTGGPGAVATLLSGLPPSFELPILLVVHVGEAFGFSFAEWLEDAGGRPVRLAKHGEALSATTGQVIMAPPGSHLTLESAHLQLSRGPERHSCRPSVDVLFESLARKPGPRAVACLLSGMGRDGAEGLLAVHRSGGLTIAQDEASSVIYGMPGEAVRLGAAQYVLPVDAIGATVARLTGAAVSAR